VVLDVDSEPCLRAGAESNALGGGGAELRPRIDAVDFAGNEVFTEAALLSWRGRGRLFSNRDVKLILLGA